MPYNARSNNFNNDQSFKLSASQKICLITPPSIFLLDERVFPNLGILKIASVLENKGVDVDVLDLSGIENFVDTLKFYLIKHQPNVFGLTTTTPQLPATNKVIQAIREVSPNSKIILGGPHVTLAASAQKLEQKAGIEGRAHRSMSQLLELADVIVSGDGELAIFEALEKGATGLIDADEPKSGMFMNHQMYEETPFPARHLIDLNTYNYKIEDHKSTSLIAQLGCPFHCGFCGGRNSKSLRYIRTRSKESILQEIELLYENYGFTGFMFYDDELNVNKGMVELMNAIADLQDKLGVEFRLRGFVKSELFNEDQAKAMYRAGFRWLLTGFESGSPRILDNMKKRATRDENSRCVEYAKKHNLKVKALMSVGHPGEDEESIMDTRDWLLSVKPDDFDCTIITTYPGTPYYDEAVQLDRTKDVYTYTAENGDRLHAYDLDFTQIEDYYKGDPEGGYKAYVYTDALSSEQIVSLREVVEKSVRQKLNIPFNPGGKSVRFEQSMGMSGPELPKFILRTTHSDI